MKREVPTWSIVAAVALAVVAVAIVFVKAGSGEASKEDLVKIRQNQRNFSAGGAPPANAETNMRRF